MSERLLILAGPVLSGLIVGASAWVAVRISVARLEERLKAHTARQDERYAGVGARLEKLETIAGAGPSPFIRREECAAIDGAARSRLGDLTEQFRALDGDVRDVKAVVDDVQRRVVHLEEQHRNGRG